MQTCTKCNKIKNIEEFRIDKRSKFGRLRRCNSCLKQYNELNKEKFTRINRERYKEKKHDPKFKQRRKEESARYRKKYPNKVKTQHKKYKEKAALRTRIYYRKNREEVRVKTSIYQKNNRGKCNAIGSKRRAAELKASPNWLSEFDLQYIKHLYIQAKELEKLDGTKYHVDHIIPLQGKTVCGLHVPWNLQILTAEENLIKSNIL
jgi:hypothetical protein